MADRLPWLQFRRVTNEKWRHRNIVLIGDAAHTTHFTTGSGATFAMQDGIALAAALKERGGIQPALEAYEKARQAALVLPQKEARRSAQWFENISRYINLDAKRFAALLASRRSRYLARVPPSAFYELSRGKQTALTCKHRLLRLLREGT